MAFSPSPQQQALFNWITDGQGSAVVVAVAGAGKTTSLVESLKLTRGSVAFVAYNKAIAAEIAARVQPMGLGNRVRASTMHAAGYGALRNAFPACQKPEPHKLRKLAAGEVEIEGTHLEIPDELQPFAVATASMAKQVGIGALVPEQSREAWLDMVQHYDLEDNLPDGAEARLSEGLRHAYVLLNMSRLTLPSGLFDFDDMIYEPVARGLRMFQNDWVFVDEAQDLNDTRRAMARMLLKPQGRLVAVGDDRQAIFGFTGASSDSLDLIKRDFNATTLPLTVTYRCPKAVVRRAQTWVSHIEAHASAPEGTVSTMTEERFWQELPGLNLSVADAILCRNTKPLVSLAYRLIKQRIPCRVEGRDIGVGLLRLAMKWKRARTMQDLRERLEEWREAEIAKAVAKGQETRAQSVEDQVDTLLEIMAQYPDDENVRVLHDAVAKLFGDTPPGETPRVLTLSTIHKAKGREWHRVFAWGSNVYLPSKWARQAWQQVQEDNLAYVQVTRAKDTLIEVEVAAPAKRER